MQLPDEYEIVEIKAPKAITNRNLESIGLRKKYKINLVTLLRYDQHGKLHIIGVPSAEEVVQDDDIIIVFGKIANINKFIEINN